MHTLIFSKLFADDMDAAWQYIMDTLKAPAAARELMAEVKQKLENLKEMPFAGPLVRDELLAKLEIRSVRVKNYGIYYFVDANARHINLIRFVYTKRDWHHILS